MRDYVVEHDIRYEVLVDGSYYADYEFAEEAALACEDLNLVEPVTQDTFVEMEADTSSDHETVDGRTVTVRKIYDEDTGEE